MLIKSQLYVFFERKNLTYWRCHNCFLCLSKPYQQNTRGKTFPTFTQRYALMLFHEQMHSQSLLNIFSFLFKYDFVPRKTSYHDISNFSLSLSCIFSHYCSFNIFVVKKGPSQHFNPLHFKNPLKIYDEISSI